MSQDDSPPSTVPPRDPWEALAERARAFFESIGVDPKQHEAPDPATLRAAIASHAPEARAFLAHCLDTLGAQWVGRQFCEAETHALAGLFLLLGREVQALAGTPAPEVSPDGAAPPELAPGVEPPIPAQVERLIRDVAADVVEAMSDTGPIDPYRLWATLAMEHVKAGAHGQRAVDHADTVVKALLAHVAAGTFHPKPKGEGE